MVNLDLAVREITKIYGSELTKDDIFLCIERAMTDALFGKGFVLIDWGENLSPVPATPPGKIKPRVYRISRGKIIEMRNIRNEYWSLVGEFLAFHLAMMKLLKVKDAKGKLVRDLTTAVIDKIDNEELLVSVEGLEGVICVVKKIDQPPGERKLYRTGQKLLFFVKRIDFDPGTNRLVAYLNRTSKTFTTKIMRYMLADRISDFYLKRGKYPVIACTKRIPGVFSRVACEINVPKKVMDKTSEILWGEAVDVYRPCTVGGKNEIPCSG